MEDSNKYQLLDFLAECFLERGASVTYLDLGGISGLRVISEEGHARIYFSAEEEVSKIAFLKGDLSEEIIIPVLKAREEIELKAALAQQGIENITVYKLSLHERYIWDSRIFLSKSKHNSVSVNGSCGL
ncbi:hypothetical protein [Salinimicrobium sp. TH3]|uniref:hypothetical protein n=1 Tax=Salinimicrobium sp. TH3 TaxID=2997342 RepID=UPI002275A2A5|nr:hypothetical protein [Salinimicrobium sp. TH3]MCY2688014.1 hypothetical protein [Salinimicrobium sp. TH3]